MTQPAFPSRAPRQCAAACLLAALLLFGAGCAAPGAGPASADRAERLLRDGDATASAQMYERLSAANAPPDKQSFGYAAARAWLAANRADDAQRVVGQLPAPADAAQQLEAGLLQVDLHLARGENAEALRRAAALPEPRQSRDGSAVFVARQRAALAANRPVDAVQAGIAQERLATTDAERTQARRDLLGRLRQAVERGARFDVTAAREALVRGWLELGTLAATSARSPLGAAGDIERWRARYPGHPGSTIIVSELLGAAGDAALDAGANRIALLLPVSGRLAGPGGQVRDGFLAAISQLPAERRPQVTVHDTAAAGGVAGALLRAQTDGSSFIVGPLAREEVTEAARDHAGRTPLLLLNHLPPGQSAPSGVYQFALSPEDEARQVAQRALAAGQQRAIVIAPSGDWGNRVVAAFRDELTRGGGTVIGQAAYDPQRNDFTESITRVLGIDDSRARHQRVEQAVGGKLGFEPRRRADVQLVFAAGQPLALRQIRPQLRFFYAGNVPTYMTSDGYDPDATANRDIDGIVFPDMPWLLQSAGPLAELRAALGQPGLEQRGGASQRRLFAFGYDAAQLALALRSAQSRWPVSGLTGQLQPGEQRRITRELDWAQVQLGQPRAVASPAAE